MSDDWEPLVKELARWEEAGRVAEFWLRDDDAVEPTPALDRLLDLTGRFAVPVCLAVIPAYTGGPLAERLAQAPQASVAVHGWSHANHASPAEKKQELGPHRPPEAVLSELSLGLERLTRLYGGRVDPVLVPPWNRIHRSVAGRLPEAGFAALSVFGPERPGPLPMLNTHVDLIDWHGTRGCRDHSVLAAELAAQIGRAFAGRARFAGLLTHHLVHDTSAWEFLERLAAITSAHPACVWLHTHELLPRSALFTDAPS
ncbi:MAG: polysaccharide deacetylase family protein [Rhizobiaceae bacterium]|nr:polysaccharide deacetylase family protein [Rhizobiaceae bacterium]